MIRLFPELWRGNIDPAKECTNADLEHIRILIQRNVVSLRSNISLSEHDTLQKVIDGFEEYCFENAQLAFSEGIFLGIRFAAEAFLTDSR